MKALVFCLCMAATGAKAEDLATVIAGVKELCNSGTSESGSSSRLEVSGAADGEMRIRLIGKAGVAGEFTMTETEWQGIQQVAASDQLADNEGRRDCVQTLTPLFLSQSR